MCLTLGNAAAIGHHTQPTVTTGSTARGYTATTHHAGHLTPGDQPLARPGPAAAERHRIHRHRSAIVLTDQYGSTWTYPATSVIPTAVPDPLHIHTSTTADGGTR
jgi:hypothetical protein